MNPRLSTLGLFVSITLLVTGCSTTDSSNEQTISSKEVAAFEPWSDDVNNEIVVAASQKSFRDWASANQAPNSKHKLVIQEGLANTRVDNLKKVDKLGSEIFGQYFTKPSITVLGKDEKWVVSELNANQIREESCLQNGGGAGGLTYCVRGRGNGYVITKNANYYPNTPGVDGTSLLPHEFFHIVQEQMSDLEGKPIVTGDANTSNLFPAWFIEGTANFVGFSVSALAFDTTYWQGYEAMFNYAPPEESINKNSIADYELRTCCGNNTPTYPYIIGQVATEYLVASAGFEKMLEIFLDYKVTNSFDKSFENVIGISKQAFYDKFDSIRGKLGFPEISWKLLCDKNYKLSEYPKNPKPCPKPNNAGLNRPGQPPQNNPSSKNPANKPDQPAFTPPPVDFNSNIDGLGCLFGSPPITNSFGSFACKELANGNNLWQKVG
jgi:hypothetical protein